MFHYMHFDVCSNISLSLIPSLPTVDKSCHKADTLLNESKHIFRVLQKNTRQLPVHTKKTYLDISFRFWIISDMTYIGILDEDWSLWILKVCDWFIWFINNLFTFDLKVILSFKTRQCILKITFLCFNLFITHSLDNSNIWTLCMLYEHIVNWKWLTNISNEETFL